MSLTDRTRATDVALNTDLYELTMAQAFWESGFAEAEGCFNAFFRDNPFGGGYAVACGTGQIADLVENFVFDDESLEYLSTVEAPMGGALFKPAFIDYLRDLRLHVDVWAIPEGELCFPREPMVRVSGPIIECQLLETALLNLVNFQTLVATKASRVAYAAKGRTVSDFGLRRAQGHDGGLSVARASYVGGCSSTSNVLAGKMYGIPVFGTHAHSWVMAFPSELDAFRAFAKSCPKNCCLLVDTYDVGRGIEHAIAVAKEMEAAGERLGAIRIDSGDLARLSKQARAAFDAANLPYVRISVSNDLDERTVQSLLAEGAPIDAFGVGTKLATCDPQPSLGGVYKLAAIRTDAEGAWRPTMKFSEQLYKRTIPGVQSVLRFLDEGGSPVADMIVEADHDSGDRSNMVAVDDPMTTYHLSWATPVEVLVQVVSKGRRAGERESLDVAKARCQNALVHLDYEHRRFMNPQSYPVGLELGLADLRGRLAAEARI